MDPRLREAWTRIVTPDDYELHMARVGQAGANASLVLQFLRDHPPCSGATILFAGAGTGQMFDFMPVDVLFPFRTTFTDINPEYLMKLSARIGTRNRITFRTVVDDIEESSLAERFDLVIAVLLLEHVDYKKAIATMARLSSDRTLVVLQENPPSLTSSMTPDRPIPASMRIFAQVNPNLLSQSTVESEFRQHGFELRQSWHREVPDQKKMVALEFKKMNG